MATDTTDGRENGGVSEVSGRVEPIGYVQSWRAEAVFVATRSGLSRREAEESVKLVNAADKALNAAPLPHRWHRCKMVFSHGDFSKPRADVEYCACGGVRFDSGRWIWRNSRREAAVTGSEREAAIQRAWDNPMPRDLQEAVEDEVAAHASDRHGKYGDVLNGINIVYPMIRGYLREHPEALETGRDR